MSSTLEVGNALHLPTDEVGDAIKAIHEDQWFDRKSFRIAPRELANVMVGFANADGGTLVVGIHDGTIEGTDRSPTHRNELMQAHIHRMDRQVPQGSTSVLVPAPSLTSQPPTGKELRQAGSLAPSSPTVLAPRWGRGRGR